ncbi:Hypothetical Protein FCC1311_030652 [Hondaea fermentalgiana]|uniref:PDZ domain-containing protein n=1 Tax=Hondaea fermentalgiana TaxID=2315210 RepID=A0A2R5GDV6_9STRA|nr:Hypothetical Protein FCC1311_030652 [Hondaea fermentalgiana]|eukprot:GBG26843.1 Hypothetical Protein FCC1311_030652 [Hondaea fermentalgiana]
MGLVSVPAVLERFDVDCFESFLGVQLEQLESGEVVLVGFKRGGQGAQGPVEKDGRVQLGDALLCIDEVPIGLVQYEVVLQKLRASQRPISLRFGRTDETIQHKVRERVLSNNAESRKRQELARLREIEAERRQREAQKAQQQEAASPSTSTRPAVYTARDLAGSRFRGFPKSAFLVIALLCASTFMYFIGITESSSWLRLSKREEEFEEEAFVAQKATIDAGFAPSDRAHASAQSKHLRDTFHSDHAPLEENDAAPAEEGKIEVEATP